MQERIVAQIEWLIWQVRLHPYRTGFLLGGLFIAYIIVRALLHLPRLE